MEQVMQKKRSQCRRRFGATRGTRCLAFLVSSAAVTLGCASGNAPAAPPACDQPCRDSVALRALRVGMRFAYNFAIQSKPVGMQDEMVPCIPSGNVHIVGDGQSNAMLGTSTLHLTYTFTNCVNPAPQNTTPERNYKLTMNGTVSETGTLAMGGPTTALKLHGTGMGFSGTVYDPPVDYVEMDCVVDASQDGNTMTGEVCGRMAIGFSGF
jgi:hypothetical protein